MCKAANHLPLLEVFHSESLLSKALLSQESISYQGDCSSAGRPSGELDTFSVAPLYQQQLLHPFSSSFHLLYLSFSYPQALFQTNVRLVCRGRGEYDHFLLTLVSPIITLE